MALKIVTSSGQSVQSFEDWKNGGKTGSSKKIITNDGQEVQSFQEWKSKKQSKSDTVSSGGMIRINDSSEEDENELLSQWQKKYQGKGYDSLASSLLELEDGDEKDWLESYADTVKQEEWQALVATKPEDWLESSDYGLKAYQQDQEDASYDEQVQNWLNQMAEAPLQDATPQFYQTVQQYRQDTSYKEINDNWSEEQRRDFGYLYAQDPQEAEEYAITVNEQLNAQSKDEQRQAVQEKATSGVLSGMGETGKAIVAGMTGIADYSNDLAEYQARGRITERDDQLTLKEYSDAVIGGVSEHLNESFGKLDKSGSLKLMEQNANYQNTGTVGDLSGLTDHITYEEDGYGLGDLYSIGVSSATSMLSGHALGQTGSLVQFFGSAAASAVDDARSRGATDEQALAYGAALGASESLTELIPIDSLLNIGKAAELKGAMWSILKQSGEEFLGEGLNSIISNIADHYIMADKSGFNVQKQEYMDGGMTEEEAKKQAWKDMLKGIVYDAVTGAASGALSGGATLGIQKGLSKILGNTTSETDNRIETVDNANADVNNVTSTSDNATRAPNNVTSTPNNVTNASNNATADKLGAIAEESSVVGAENATATSDTATGKNPLQVDQGAKVESTVTKNAGKDESSAVKVGVSKMENVQMTEDIDSFAQQFGTQANRVKQNYIKGQNVQEYELGVQTAYALGLNSKSKESLNNMELPGLKYLTQSQRENAYLLGRDAAAAQKELQAKATAATETATLGQQAHLIADDGGDGGSVTISEITSIDENGMTFRLEDGRTVTDEDLSFEDGAEVYSTLLELGVDVKSANAIVRSSATVPQSQAELAEGIETAHRFGKYGYGMDALLKAPEATNLPESILKESYRAGEKHRKKARQAAQNRETDKKAASNDSDSKGKVHFNGNVESLNKVQRESMRGLEWIADLTGARIFVEDMGGQSELSDKNGMYDPADDSIHIDLRAGSDGSGTLLYTAAHEFVHRMKQNNEAAFYRLADFLVAEYGKKGISTDALVRQQMTDAASAGIDLTYDEAFVEMVADAMQGMFTDTDVMAKMEKLKAQDKTLWQEIKDFVLELAEKIKSAYRRLKPDSAEARYVLQMKETVDQLAELFAEGIMDSGAEKNTTGEGGEKVRYSVRKNVTDVDGNVYGDVIELEYRTFNKIRKSTKAYIDFIRNNLIKQKITVYNSDGNPEIIEFARVNERVQKDGSSNFRRVLGELERVQGDVKKLIITNAEEVAEISEIKNHSSENSHQWLDQNGWDERWSYVMTKDGMIYPVILHIAKTRDGRNLLYSVNVDITKGIGIDKGATSAQMKNHVQQAVKVPTPSDEFNLTQKQPGVKTKNSLRKDPNSTEALQWQNKKLQEDVDRLRDLLKLQSKVTHGAKFKRSSVEAAAKYLKKLFHTDGDTRELADQLNVLYEYIASDPNLTWEGVQEQAAPIVDWLQEHEKFQRSQYAQQILDTLKGQNFYLDETQKQEAVSRYGSLVNYRRAVKNMSSNKSTQSLDQLWQELSSQYPDIFSPNTGAADMPLMFADALDMLENMEDTETAMDWRMKDQSMLREVYDSYWRVSSLETVADRSAKKENALKSKHYEQMEKLRKQWEDAARAIDIVHKTAMKELREEKNRQLKAQHDRQIKQNEKSRKISQENREKAAIRKRIRKTVKVLDTLLKSETKEKHVPDSMKKAVADALSLMNELDLGITEKRIEAAKTSVRELKQKLEQAKGFADSSLIADLQAQLDEKQIILERYEKSSSRLNVLKDAYEDIGNSADPDIASGYDADVAGALNELAETIKDTAFQDMSRDQLQDVLDMYTMVLTRIRDANKQLGARRGETLQENAAETEADIRKFGISEKDPGMVADKLGKMVRGFSWKNLRPVDAFHRLGSKKLEQLYMDLVDGMAQRGRQIKEIGQFITDIRKKTGYKGFDLKKAETYTTVDGKNMKLTLAEKMSIYAYSKREQAFDHMTQGGFTFASDQAYTENKKTKVRKEKADTWRLTMEDLQTICNSLTEQQRQYVDAVQQFLTEFGKHGDKVNMELYGIKLFSKERYYFPLKSDRDYRKSVETQLGSTMTAASLKNDGMTKKTVPGANNPIVLEDFDRVVFAHLDKMVNYANLVLPLENLRRVFDYQTAPSENAEPTSMKKLIGATFGKEAQQYVEQFLTDANGTRMGMSINPLETMFTRSKGMSVSANLSVSIQQISAVVRAGAEISPLHLVWAAKNRKGVKLYDEMVEYAPIAIIKDMGGFDAGSNQSIEDYIGFEEAPKSATKTWNSMQKFFGKGAETMDKVGWCLIWNGVKREVASRKQYKINSEEFLQECGKRFTEVIVKTQVYDSVLSRSGFMRDKHGTMRYLTSFMGEPTVQAGMVFTSHLDVVRAVQSKNKSDISHSLKKLARTDGALVAALLVNGMLKAIPYAMRDDDEDEGYWERWAKHFGSAVSELWKPWELLPILRNIDDIWKGYSVTQPDMALLEGLLQAGKRVYDVMQDEEKLGEMTAEDYYTLAKDLLGSLGNFFGVPVENIWRDLEGITRVFKDMTDGIDSDGMLLDALMRGVKGEEKTKHESIYDAMVSGDKARLDALKATYKTDSSYESAVRKALRLHDPRIKEMANARYEDDYDRLEAISYEIESEGIFDMATIKAAYEAERTAQAKERGITLEEDSADEQAEESTAFSMDDYYAAIRNGSKDSIQTAYNALIEEKKDQEHYLQHEAEDSIASSVTSKVKGEYLDEDISKADAVSVLMKYGGKTSDEAETEIKKWEFQMEYHYAWGSRDRCYRSGTISRSQLASAVMDIEDTSWAEAQEYVDFLDLEMQNEKVDITASDASSYFEHAEPYGISVDVYLDYKDRTKGIQNDKDANGNSISYSAVQKKMSVINSLPITRYQKDVLADSEGWSDSTIQKYKQW